jgi:hypothetical protein
MLYHWATPWSYRSLCKGIHTLQWEKVTVYWASLDWGEGTSGSTTGAATVDSHWSQNVYWQKTKLERLKGSPVASLIFTWRYIKKKKEGNIAPIKETLKYTTFFSFFSYFKFRRWLNKPVIHLTSENTWHHFIKCSIYNGIYRSSLITIHKCNKKCANPCKIS